MTMQQVFDIAAPALLAQGKESMRRRNPDAEDDFSIGLVCAYRGDNGLKCAIGHIIPDSIYNVDMEGRAVMEVYTMYPEFKTLLTGEGEWEVNMASFLEALQSVHDNYEPNKWDQALRDLADDFSLNTDSITPL